MTQHRQRHEASTKRRSSPDSNDIGSQQALRLRRVVLGMVSYLFTLTLVAVYWYLGFYRLPVLLNYFCAIVALNVFFYVAIRSNFNLRFADPSMTLAQICLSLMPGLYVMYHAQQARGVFVLLCVSAAMYGLFQFRTRDYVIMTAVVVGGYAALILAVFHFKPTEINLQVEILQLFALCATFLQFSGLGSYIGSLRAKVKDKNKELAARNDDLEHALRRIEELAMRDELTGVFNRRYLMEPSRMKSTAAKGRAACSPFAYLTSTCSSTSTTATATWWATRCCSRLPRWRPGRCARPTISGAMAAKNSCWY